MSVGFITLHYLYGLCNFALNYTYHIVKLTFQLVCSVLCDAASATFRQTIVMFSYLIIYKSYARRSFKARRV
jgi:hypothetical protein